MGRQSGQQTNNFKNAAYLIDTFNHSLGQKYNFEVLIPRFYVQERLSISQIAIRLEVSRDYIRKTLVRLKVPIRSERRPLDLCSQTPYGWKKKIGTMVPHVYEQRVLERIVLARREGRSLRKIAVDLTKDGVATKAGGRWHAKTVSRILERNQTLLKDFKRN